MSRSIPIALAAHLAEPATTTCRLWRVAPAAGGTPFGLTSLDRDVTYDDGAGAITYKAKRGYTPYAIEATADLSVDNSEMEVLIAEFEVDGFTSEAIDRGVYDDARFIEYLVNYENLSDGKAIMSSGTVGRIRKVDNMVCFPESRSLTQTLKQKSIIERGSNSCRAEEFGGPRCGVNVAALWFTRTVTVVGTETDRVFTLDGAAIATDALKPGLAECLTGANAGRSFEIESNAGNVITLAVPTASPIAVSDSWRVRPDCTRLWEGANSCDTYSNRPIFRGEPWRPVAGTGGLMVPGAGSTGTDAQATAAV